MATLYEDLDFDDIDWSEHELRTIAQDLYDRGYVTIRPIDLKRQLTESADSRSYSELELFELIQSLIANRCFITSDQIKRIKDIIE